MIKPIIFFGSEDFSARSLEALVEAGFTIDAIVTKPDTKRGRGKTLTAPKVKEIGIKHGITVMQPAFKAELTSMLEPFKPGSHVGVLVSYGMIIPQNVIDMFEPGIINVHPSLLPRYRGPTPIENAILNGDQETGVTIMKLDAKMDSGPIYAFSPFELTGTEAQTSLSEELGTLGAQILVAALPGIFDGSIQANPQDDTKATFTSLLKKSDGFTDTSQLTAAEIERKIRAFQSYPKTKIAYGEHSIQPTKAHVTLEGSEGHVFIRCKSNTFLTIDMLIAPSGKQMSGEAFLRGYRS